MSKKNGEIYKSILEECRYVEPGMRIIDQFFKPAVLKALDAKDRDHEALMGVLVGALKFYKSEWEGDADVAPDGTVSFGVEPSLLLRNDKGKVATEAISHPLVQEYLKKEKKP